MLQVVLLLLLLVLMLVSLLVAEAASTHSSLLLVLRVSVEAAAVLGQGDVLIGCDGVAIASVGLSRS